VVRKDLSKPQQVVQSCHAAIESAKAYLTNPQLEHPHVIVLGVDNEAQLRHFQLKIMALGIESRAFYEPDIGNQMTAIASRPVFGLERKPFARLKLLEST